MMFSVGSEADPRLGADRSADPRNESVARRRPNHPIGALPSTAVSVRPRGSVVFEDVFSENVGEVFAEVGEVFEEIEDVFEEVGDRDRKRPSA
jgi:hypothetical protein